MNDSSTSNAAPNVHHLRSSLDLTQQDFATLLGISTVSVSRWESNKTLPEPEKETLLNLLAQAIDRVGPDEVLMLLRNSRASTERTIGLVRLIDSAPVRKARKAAPARKPVARQRKRSTAA